MAWQRVDSIGPRIYHSVHRTREAHKRSTKARAKAKAKAKRVEDEGSWLATTPSALSLSLVNAQIPGGPFEYSHNAELMPEMRILPTYPRLSLALSLSARPYSLCAQCPTHFRKGLVLWTFHC